MSARPRAAATGDARSRAALEVNGWARVVDRKRWLDREAVGALARRGSSGDALDAPAAAVKVPASVATRWFDGSDDTSRTIDPRRCVWVVTVKAPWAMDRRPPNVVPKTFTQYTVSFDAASGQGIDMMAGVGAPDMLTGEHAPEGGRSPRR